MYYLRCDKCGHFNPVSSQYMVYCEKCKTHLANNYIDWVGRHPEKNFDDYKSAVCVTEADVPPQPTVVPKSRERVIPSEIDEPQTTKKQKPKLSRNQLLVIIVVVVAALVFGYLGKKVASNRLAKWQLNKISTTDFAESETENWSVFVCDEADFSIRFPEAPAKNSQLVETEIGKLEVTQYLFEPALGKDANLVYGAGFTKYPADHIDGEKMGEEELSEFFTNSINGTVANVQGKLLTTHIIDYKGYPGREIKIDFRDGLAVIKMRSFLVKNKMYIIQVISPAKNTFNKSINFFLDSFKLKEEI